MSEEEVILLGLIRRYDTKMATHIGGIIATTFGLFTILNLLRGAGWLPRTGSAVGLFVIELSLPFLIFFFVCRSIHYTAMIENLAKRSIRIRNLGSNAFYDTLKTMPRPIRWVINKRNSIRYNGLLLIFIFAYVVWVLIVIAVLALPNP